MIFWTIMFYIAVGSFLILTGLLIFRKYCKNYYYHSFIRDELLKEEKIGNGTNYIYSTSKENSDIIPRYIIRNSPYEKSIVLEYKEKYEYIEYYIKCYNSKNKVIEIYDVKEENTTNISKIISVDKNTQAINIFIKNVNHDVDINTSEIKPISRRNIHLYSLELSLNIFFILFLLRQIILYFVLIYLIGIIVQRIIFNVSKSDVLSVLGMFVIFTLPNVIDDKTINLNSKFITLSMLLSIYVLQILLDELKQLNIKNRKYIVQAVILGFCVGLSTIFGVNYLIWEIIAIVSIFITSNLDSTSLNLSNRQNKTIKRKKNNYFIYKIERIKISKLIVSLCIIIFISSIIYFSGRMIIRKLAYNQNGVCENIVNDLTVGIHTDIDKSFTNIKAQAYKFSSMSTKFYIFCYIYIIAMEILSVLLHRKYDTKSTVIKLSFVLLYTIITIFKLNIVYYQPVLTALLVIICIVNTTNIYYNREERVKMIEA